LFNVNGIAEKSFFQRFFCVYLFNSQRNFYNDQFVNNYLTLMACEVLKSLFLGSYCCIKYALFIKKSIFNIKKALKIILIQLTHC